jgi:hypothetical protein
MPGPTAALRPAKPVALTQYRNSSPIAGYVSGLRQQEGAVGFASGPCVYL